MGGLDFTIQGISITQLGISLLLLFAGFAAGRVVQIVLGKIAARTIEQTLRHAVLGAVSVPAAWALRLFGVWGALTYLPLRTVEAFDLSHFVNSLWQAATIGLATWLGVRLVSNLAGLWAQRATSTEGTFDDQLVPIVRSSSRVFLILTGTVMILQNLGYSVSSLLAGLGIGGAAIAFASKDAIANVFGSLVIFIDRPFQVGDWVEIGGVEGTVESVRLRVTAVRTFAGSLITVPNSQMTTTAIQNWSRMKKRRLQIDIGLRYGTPPDKVQAAVDGIRDLIAKDERFDHEFYLVSLSALRESSLGVLVYSFTKTTSWAEFMAIQQDFLLSVLRLLQDLGVEVALPTRTLHLQPDASRALPAMLRPASR